ncbi:hypothetical protein D6833_05250 [Candidatus Parcubacteria bacterium]|nr:MAG: hypothetical protein D6833_05250 [Candidatus Parcubacteria bacterium]
MKNTFFILAAFLLLSGCGRLLWEASCESENRWEKLLAQAHDSVAAVIAQNQKPIGSGFLIDPQHIVTASHVAQTLGPDGTLTVTFGKNINRPIQARLVAEDAAAGLAVLELEQVVSHQPFVLAAAEDIQLGEPVVALGNPFGMGLVASAGIVGALPGTVQGGTSAYLHTDAAIHPGNSGGPLLDHCGRVVGLVTAHLRGGGIGLAIPSKEIARFIDLNLSK